MQLVKLAPAQNRPQAALTLLENHLSFLAEAGIVVYLPLVRFLQAQARQEASQLQQQVTLWPILALMAELEEAKSSADKEAALR